MRTGLTLVFVLFLAACARPGDAQDPPPRAAFDTRAADVTAAWDRLPPDGPWFTGFVPLEALTRAPKIEDEARRTALDSGRLTLSADLPGGSRDGEVAFPDGARLPVGLVTAEAAFHELAPGAPPECTGGPAPSAPGTTSHTVPCTTLTVTRAELGTTPLLTSRGIAETPAWLFTVAGLAEPVARVAVDPTGIQTPPRPDIAPATLPGYVDAGSVESVNGTTVTFTLVTGACDTDVTPVVAETPTTVVIAGTVRTESGDCVDLARYTPVTVTLSAPLGARPLLSARSGEVVGRGPF